MVRRKIIVSTIILLLCFLLPLLSALVATTVSQATSQDEQIFQAPDIKLPEQGHLKLQSELFQLIEIEKRGEASAFVQRSGVDLVDGMVRVVIEAAPGQARLATQAAETLGTMVETIHADWVQVVVPISMLTALADTPSIDSVRLPQIPWPAGTSEGLDLINAPEWHSAGFTGAGVKVAILDLGFQGYDALLGTELPDSVTVQSFRSDGDITDSGQVHGTACAEIVYDIVPDADFYLVNFGTDVEWSNAVDWLIAQEVDVISSSIIWVNTGPGDGTGPICEKVAEARSAGILWSNAAGNQALLHWMGSWEDTDSDDWHEFDPGLDESNAIYADSGYPIVIFLKWDDPWGASSNDYNLYLFDDTAPVPNRVAWSQNVQNGNDDPVERLIYMAEYDGYYHIAIQEASATEAVSFHLHTYYGDLQYRVSSGSLLEPADSSSAVTVGAVRWDNLDVLESFSSQGPTADGRTKPDLVAPDRVSTMSYGAGAFWGTSSSAPHVAGAAALVKDRHPSYTPADIQAFLEGLAVDLGDVGKDNLYGSGMLYLGPANTPPVVENVIASQREGTGFVDISYDLSDAEQNSIDVSFQHWDGSGSWLDCVTITGDGATSTGTVKIGTWDAKADFDGQYCADCRIRIIADDGLPSNNIGQGDSPEFTLDTKNPTGYSCATLTDGDIEVPVNTVLTSLIASDDSPPITYKFMLAEDSGFTQGVQESDWLSTNSWNPTTLKSSHDYWWKMKAEDTFENGGDWCAVFTFTTVAHPGGLHSQLQISITKQKIQQNMQPWENAYNELIARANGYLSHSSQAVEDFHAPGYYSDPEGSLAAKRLIQGDGVAAYTLALSYQLDDGIDRTRYADKAVELLNSWATINKTVSGVDGPEYMCTGGIGLIHAADLVWNYDGWNVADRDNFTDWVNSVFQGAANAIIGESFNWGCWGTMASISAAYLVDDQETIDHVIELIKNRIRDTIESDGHLPYETRYGAKGLWYTYYALAPLTAACQVALNASGVDLFHYTSPNGRNIKMALDCLFYYSEHPDEWPYYDGELSSIPNPHSWPGNLFMAMAAIYDGDNYKDWVTSLGPVYDSTWWDVLHITWYFPVLMQPLSAQDTTPYTTGHNPAKGATGVAPDTNIVVHVKDDGTGVDQDSIVMTVEGETVTPSVSGAPSDYTLTYDPPADFEHSQVVDVTVDARDLASPPNVMPQDAYSFTIAATPEALMEGDGSLNEHVQVSDAMSIAQYAAGLVSLTDDQLTCADTTDDGSVTMADAMHIAQWLVDPDGTLGVLNKPLWETPADDDMLHPAL